MPFGIKTETTSPASQLIKSILNFLSLNLNTIDYFSDLEVVFPFRSDHASADSSKYQSFPTDRKGMMISCKLEI